VRGVLGSASRVSGEQAAVGDGPAAAADGHLTGLDDLADAELLEHAEQGGQLVLGAGASMVTASAAASTTLARNICTISSTEVREVLSAETLIRISSRCTV